MRESITAEGDVHPAGEKQVLAGHVVVNVDHRRHRDEFQLAETRRRRQAPHLLRGPTEAVEPETELDPPDEPPVGTPLRLRPPLRIVHHDVEDEQTARTQSGMPVPQRPREHLVGEVLHHRERVDDVDVTPGPGELVDRAVLQVRGRIEDPGTREHSPRHIDCGNRVNPRRYSCGKVAGAATDVQDVVVRVQVTGENLVSEHLPGLAVTFRLAVPDALTRSEVVRAQRQQPQRCVRPQALRRRGQHHRDPTGTQEVLLTGGSRRDGHQPAHMLTGGGSAASHACRPLGRHFGQE